MRISDWSSDVCSSDLAYLRALAQQYAGLVVARHRLQRLGLRFGAGRRRLYRRIAASLSGHDRSGRLGPGTDRSLEGTARNSLRTKFDWRCDQLYRCEAYSYI